MRRATQFDRFLDGQWHTIRPGVDVKFQSLNAVASAFRSVAKYRGLFPFSEWNAKDGTISLLAASRIQADEIVRGRAKATPKPTLDDYLRLRPSLTSAQAAELTGRILEASRS